MTDTAKALARPKDGVLPLRPRTTPLRALLLRTVSTTISRRLPKERELNRCTEYLDTTIILDAADLTFHDTLGLTDADSTGLTTSDNGKTWKVTTINIHEHSF